MAIEKMQVSREQYIEAVGRSFEHYKINIIRVLDFDFDDENVFLFLRCNRVGFLVDVQVVFDSEMGFDILMARPGSDDYKEFG